MYLTGNFIWTVLVLIFPVTLCLVFAGTLMSILAEKELVPDCSTVSPSVMVLFCVDSTPSPAPMNGIFKSNPFLSELESFFVKSTVVDCV